jgi:CheY-like chemotaxis protein
MRPQPSHRSYLANSASSSTLDEDARAARFPRVLVAEDDTEMRMLLVRMLRKDGYHVEEVGSGAELLHRIGTSLLSRRGEPPELIISDIRMPGFTGLEVLSGLREADWAMPVILITAFGDSETHAEAQRLGAEAVFDKPFDMDELRSAVHQVALQGK